MTLQPGGGSKTLKGNDGLAVKVQYSQQRRPLPASEASHKEEDYMEKASTGDELRELATRGLCSALWRSTVTPKPGGHEADVHKLQTGWCRYQGTDAAVRSNVWLCSQSPSAACILEDETARARVPMPSPLEMGLRQQLHSPGGSGSAPMTPGGRPRPPLFSYGSHPSKGALLGKASSGLQQGHSLSSAGTAGTPSRSITTSLSEMVATHFKPGSLSTATPPISPFTRAWNHNEQDRGLQQASQVTGGGQRLGPEWASSSATSETLHAPFFPSSQSCPPPHSLLATFMRSKEARRSEAELQQGIQLSSWNSSQPLELPLQDSSTNDPWLDSVSMFSGSGNSLPADAGDSLVGLFGGSGAGGDLGVPSDLDCLLEDSLGAGGPGLGSLESVGALLDPQTPHLAASQVSLPPALPVPALQPSHLFRRPQLPERVVMAIVSAPAMFSQPSSINKVMAPAFTVRVGVVSPLPSQIKATIAAYILSKEQLQSLEKWHPGQQLLSDALGGAVVTESIVCHGPTHPKLPQTSPGKHTGVAEFVFTDLKFQSSSRMKPVWVVFALTMPTDDVLFVQYTVPTVVMSRQCDQQSKALFILRGQLPSVKKRKEPEGRGPQDSFLRSSQSAPVPTGAAPCLPVSQPQLLRAEDLVGPGPPALIARPLALGPAAPPLPALSQQELALAAPSPAIESRLDSPPAVLFAADWPRVGPFNYEQWRLAVGRFVQLYTPRRGLSRQDTARLEQLAGFSLPGGAADQTLELPPQKWAAFGEWFLSFMHLFSFYHALWTCTAPMAICGFGVDRVMAEASLRPQPSGTFLIRPSLSLGRTLVLSLSLDGTVKHMALEAQQLDTRTLEVWVRDVTEATHLLDLATGSRFLKDEVFLLHYRRLEPKAVESPSGVVGAMANAHQPLWGEAAQPATSGSGLTRRESSGSPMKLPSCLA